MAKFIRDLIYWLNQSLWFIPLVMIILTFALSFLFIQIDKSLHLHVDPEQFDFLFKSQDGARQVLATIAGSMITVAGVVFSISLVAISMVSSQYGPRVLPDFMRNRLNQIVLGIFSAAFLYCTIVLAEFSWPDELQVVPVVSIYFGFVLSLLSIIVLIYFIHNIHNSVQITTIIAHSAKEIDKYIEKTYPLYKSGYCESPPDRDGLVVNSVKSGYVQDIDDEGLLIYSEKHDLEIDVLRNPGEFAAADSPLVKVKNWPYHRSAKKLEKRMNSFFSIGAQRTPIMDILYNVEKLVQIALRALSPAINDPLTVLLCIDRLGEALVKTAYRFDPHCSFADRKGKIRLHISFPTFNDLLYEGFEPILLLGRSNPRVILHLVNILTEITEHVNSSSRLEAVAELAKAIEIEEGDRMSIHRKKLFPAYKRLHAKIYEVRKRLTAQEK
ncbi:MAG: DUF2254 domain-containing protein [Fibrobacter sp.]|nr:DUF2254 domain-containing protein [Fibrobacter sp.]